MTTESGFTPGVMAKVDQITARLDDMVATTRAHFAQGCPNADLLPPCISDRTYALIEESSWAELANMLGQAVARLAKRPEGQPK